MEANPAQGSGSKHSQWLDGQVKNYKSQNIEDLKLLIWNGFTQISKYQDWFRLDIHAIVP